MPAHKTYELTTIKDIFDKVPIDRMEALFKELLILFEQAAFVRGAAGALTDDKDAVIFPESITWLDDGLGEIEARFGSDNSGNDFLVLRTSLSPA